MTNPNEKTEATCDYGAIMSSFFDADRDVSVLHRTFRVVTTRKPNSCMCWAHGERFDAVHGHIPPGTRACVEKALVDDKWSSCYVCTRCLDSYAAYIKAEANGDWTHWKCEVKK